MNNTDLDRKLRALSSDLAVSGRGVILYSAWETIKVLFLFLYSPDWRDIREMTFQQDLLLTIIYITILVFLLLFIGGIYFYVGISAVSHSRGKKKVFYLFVDVLMIVVSVLSIYADLDSILKDWSKLYELADVFMEFVIIFALLDLLFAGVRVLIIHRKKEG